MSNERNYMFTFQAQFNGDEWNTIPPLCTNNIKDLMITIEDLVLNDDSSFIYRVIATRGRAIITNDPSGFENNPFDHDTI